MKFSMRTKGVLCPNRVLAPKIRSSSSGFTLAEMMVVMLILSIIMAAFAPVMTTRSKVDLSSPWRYASNNSDIYYGIGDSQTAMIGQRKKKSGDLDSRLVINTSSSVSGQKHILFKSGGDASSSATRGYLSLYDSNNLVLGSGGMTNGEYNVSIGHEIGNNNTGDNKVAIGFKAMKRALTGSNNTVIGANTQGAYNGDNYTVIGAKAYANSDSVAIGYNASVNTGEDGVAIGANSNSSGYESIALGKDADASLDKAIAIGKAISKSGGVALGYDSEAYGGAVALGISAKATLNNNTSIGPYASSKGTESTALGSNSKANDSYAVSLGSKSESYVDGTSVGYYAKAGGTDSIAIGYSSDASGNYSTAVGSASDASGQDAVALGNNAQANGYRVTALGYNSCRGVTGSNKTCIGANSGPNDYSQATDNSVESLYFGSPGVFHSGSVTLNNANSIFELHKKGTYAVAYLNADLVVNGLIWAQVGGKDGHSDALGFFRSKTWKNQIELYNEATPPYPSDRRLKYVGQESKSGLDKIRQLKVFNYTFKQDKKQTPHVGVIAQDLQKVFPDAVIKDDGSGYLKIRFEDMFYALINAVKELDSKLCSLLKHDNEQDLKIKSLEAQNKELKARLEKLEKSLR